MHGHRHLLGPLLSHALGGLDRPVGLQAAGPGLDPVALDGRLGLAGLGQPPAGGLGEARGRGGQRDARPGRRQPGRAQARGGGKAHLKRLAVRPERGPQAGRAHQGERPGAVLGGAVEAEQPGGGHGRPQAAAHRGGVKARVVEGGVAGPGQRAHRLEAGGVGREHLARCSAQLGAEQQRHGRGGGAQVRDAGQVGVVEVEHVAGGRGRRHRVTERGGGRAPRARSRRAPRRPASRGRRPRSAGRPAQPSPAASATASSRRRKAPAPTTLAPLERTRAASAASEVTTVSSAGR